MLGYWKTCILLLACIECIFAIQKPISRNKKFFGLGAPAGSTSDPLPKEQWFIQNLDHFVPSNLNTWKQRFYVNDEFFDEKNPGPVFLMIGGEGEINAEWMVRGQWIEYAKKFKALCFQLEHRFYGKSWPTSDTSTKNLAYLNSQQALADLANFITTMNDKYKLNSDTKWVMFGGSYPGSLAAWMRSKYPHLVHAAISSSAPLLAKVDFMEYYSVVIDSLRTSSDECVAALKESIIQISRLLEHRVGQRSLSTKFNLCDSIENSSSLDKSSFYENIADLFADVVQYNGDNRMGNTKMVNKTIDVICRMLTDKSAGYAIDRLANINSLILNVENETCRDYKYDKMIDVYRNVSWNATASEGGRQWMYQTCNEFGFYQTSSAEVEFFSNQFPLKYFIQQCMDIYGKKFNLDYVNEAARRTNMIYGDLHIQSSRIVYLHGSIDPWHALGITKTTEQNNPAIFIKGTAHCADMYPARDEDLPELKAARESVLEYLQQWLLEK